MDHDSSHTSSWSTLNADTPHSPSSSHNNEDNSRETQQGSPAESHETNISDPTDAELVEANPLVDGKSWSMTQAV